MSKSLALILKEADEISEMIVAAEGDITPDLEARMMLIGDQMSEKVDAIAYIEEVLGNNAELFKLKASRFNAIAKGLLASQEYLRNRVKGAMLSNGFSSIEGEDHKITFYESGVKVLIPNELTEAQMETARLVGAVRAKISETIDKDVLKVHLLAGVKMDWAHLEPIHILKISVNSKRLKAKNAASK